MTKAAHLAVVAVPVLTVAVVALSFVRGARPGFDAAQLELMDGLAPAGPSSILTVRHYEPGQSSSFPVALRTVQLRSEALGDALSWTGDVNDDGVAFVPLVAAKAPRSATHVTARAADGRLLFERTFGRDVGVTRETEARLGVSPRSRGEVPLSLWALGTGVPLGGTLRLVGRAAGAVKGGEASPAVTLASHDGLEVVLPLSSVDQGGYFDLTVRALSPAASLELHVEQGGARGDLSATVRVLPGGVMPEVAALVSPSRPFSLSMRSPGSRQLYAAVRSSDGVLLVDAPKGRDGESGGEVQLPGLPEGLYWASAASLPESWRYGIDVPFVVADNEVDARKLLSRLAPCDPGAPLTACLAPHANGPEPRIQKVEMAPILAARVEKQRASYRRVALAAIAVGALLENWMVWMSWVRGRRSDEEGAGRSRPRTSVGPALFALSLAWLGFALLGAAVWLLA